MYKLAFSEEAERVAYIGIVHLTQQIIIAYTSLLLCCKILVKIGKDIALYRKAECAERLPRTVSKDIFPSYAE